MAAGILLAGVGPARAQTGDVGPGGESSAGAKPRLAVGADLSVTLGPDDEAYFNYTDYELSALRLLVGAIGLSFRVAPWLDAVAEGRIENAEHAWVSALYARVRPWSRHGVTITAGRVPPVFGAFALTRYGSENPLVSRPLAYQYLTTLRYDDVAASADALLAVRGRGWLVRYPEPATGVCTCDASYPPGGSPVLPAAPAAGVPVISSSRWDTGLVVHVRAARIDASGGLTVGSLSDPRVRDNNGGRQLVGRIVWRPTLALSVGASAASGAFLSDEAARRAIGRDGASWHQRALAVDAGFARDHLEVRGEVIVSSWDVPAVAAPRLDSPLRATAAIVEARYRVHPRLDVAMRVDYVGFSRISGTLYDGAPTPWDADVSRVEVGGSLRLARRVRLKLAYQVNHRDTARRRSASYPAIQLVTWF